MTLKPQQKPLRVPSGCIVSGGYLSARLELVSEQREPELRSTLAYSTVLKTRTTLLLYAQSSHRAYNSSPGFDAVDTVYVGHRHTASTLQQLQQPQPQEPSAV